jgi:hypothetical protein
MRAINSRRLQVGYQLMLCSTQLTLRQAALAWEAIWEFAA